ncbi:MAG TPA: enolase C-terminal domain-like protein [Aliidongia sp.]|uniref:enolase C-terminal domain-like protein n=1 Tax=Aliidongia sp. TaxID=1914230 RepID=UPI002DDD12E3|nr:enolase C-terminal domain-like protein [Aliidongia sp.]HEV2673353.1 enolase C-terminal domain-like protein [Aliidongia sp.]
MDAKIEHLSARTYTIPTDLPEADGTAAWTSTTLVVVQVRAAGKTGLGYSYTHASAAVLIATTLAQAVLGRDAMDPQAAWSAMQAAVRNLGRDGLAATAISAVDTALWDLKAVLVDQPLATLLGRYREAVPIYGSGGFTSYDDRELARQLAGWVEREGCHWVKMKIGTHPEQDPARVAAAKSAIGSAGLFVDANGAFGPKQAQHFARLFMEQDVLWFEEPVSSDDLAGLRLVREHSPAPMEIAAGEYGYSPDYFRRMLEAGAVDVLQADATRCGGVTGFLQAATLAAAFHTDLSAHCAPALHSHLGCATPRFRHVEWFHDHARIERMLFDGAPLPRDGTIAPDRSRPGLGLTFKTQDAERFAVASGGRA